MLRPERLRQVPQQFSWVDQALVQQHFIERLDARAAALYLFLVTVADAQGLSYWSDATLAGRLHCSAEQLDAARAQLLACDLIAYARPLTQVLSLPGRADSPRKAARLPTSGVVPAGQPLSLAHLINQLEARRGRL